MVRAERCSKGRWQSLQQGKVDLSLEATKKLGCNVVVVQKKCRQNNVVSRVEPAHHAVSRLVRRVVDASPAMWESSGRETIFFVISSEARRLPVRWLLVLLLSVLGGIQGWTWSLFSSVPLQSQDLFGLPSDSATTVLTWTLSANNIGQIVATPFATWLLFDKRGLRRVVVCGSVTIVLQQALWAAAAFFCRAHIANSTHISSSSSSSSSSAFEIPTPTPTNDSITAFGASDDDAGGGQIPPSSVAAGALLLVGAAIGGFSSAFTQGAVSRFSAEWFEPAFRTRVTSIVYTST